MPNYHIEAIDSCREKLDGVKGKFPECADGLPTTCAPDMYGQLAGSGAISSAVDTMAAALRDEFQKAGERAGQISGALDKISVSVQQDEEVNAEMMRLESR
ncbi:MAG: hypothetical protein GEU98_19685 [Pseudonocardiaceae bacterium]|nr:hypothetical protein [Pseudonocardiaceae bacterium]